MKNQKSKRHNFELAPLSKFPRELFISKDNKRNKANAFILSLALVFNDFKDLEWWVTQLEKGQPEEFKIDGYCGEFSGMQFHIARLWISLFFELTNLIEKNKLVLEYSEIICVTSELSGDCKKYWEDLVEVSTNWRNPRYEGGSTLRAILHRVRSKAAFHYDSKELIKQYETFFNKNIENSEYAYASLGENMRQTRFYFADATAQTVIEASLVKLRLTIKELMDATGLLMNEAIKTVVEEYISSSKIE